MRYLKFILIAGVLGVIGYYTASVSLAILETPEKVQTCLRSEAIKLQASELTPRQREILIAVQDPNFMNHKGVEFSTPGSGWTTITQSIVKKLYFDDFRQGIAKIRQTLIARFALHGRMTKEEQLTAFINLMWFEKNVTGLSSAAEHYYQKSVRDLSEDEFISIVAMIIDPKRFNINSHPENNKARTDAIKRMLSGEYVPKGLFDITYDKQPHS